MALCAGCSAGSFLVLVRGRADGDEAARGRGARALQRGALLPPRSRRAGAFTRRSASQGALRLLSPRCAPSLCLCPPRSARAGSLGT